MAPTPSSSAAAGAETPVEPLSGQPSELTSDTNPGSSTTPLTQAQNTDTPTPVTTMDPNTAAEPDASPPNTVPSTTSNSKQPQAATTSHPQAPPSSSSNQPSQAIQNLLADRRRRLEIDKKEKEAAEKVEKKAKVEARQAAMTADPNSAKAKQATYAAQQRKRQQEAKLERERIVRQIEHDKKERKEKEELRKALARAEAEEKNDTALADKQLSTEMNGPRPARSKECAVQVRMFDGSVIRSRFPSESTLRTDVRAWIDKERLDGDAPYTFKQILTPLPNRPLSISDEEDSLQTLGLTPSATLVMVPVQGYTAAYAPQGIVSRGASVGYNFVSTGTGMITRALGTFLGFGQTTAQGDQSAAHGSPPQYSPDADPRGAGSSINIRTLRDRRENRDDHQLYNGNQASLLHAKYLLF